MQKARGRYHRPTSLNHQVSSPVCLPQLLDALGAILFAFNFR